MNEIRRKSGRREKVLSLIRQLVFCVHPFIAAPPILGANYYVQYVDFDYCGGMW